MSDKVTSLDQSLGISFRGKTEYKTVQRCRTRVINNSPPAQADLALDRPEADQ